LQYTNTLTYLLTYLAILISGSDTYRLGVHTVYLRLNFIHIMLRWHLRVMFYWNQRQWLSWSSCLLVKSMPLCSLCKS